MELCARVDDIVWSQSDKVWDDTFTLVMLETRGVGELLYRVMRMIHTRVAEYEMKYLKVQDILRKLGDSPAGVERLALHYNDIKLRYRLAYDSCKAIDLVI
jgi:hypothetical protein